MSALSDALAEAKNSRAESIDAVQERARSAGFPLHRATIAKYLADGIAQRPSEQTIQGLAAGFLLRPQRIRELLDMPAGERGPWTPPDESVRLNREQRDALDQLIKAFTRGAEQVSTNGDGQTLREPSHNGDGQTAQPSTPKESQQDGLDTRSPADSGGSIEGGTITLPQPERGGDVEQQQAEQHQEPTRG